MASSKEKFESKCPICAGASHPEFIKHEYWIYACEKCKHQFANLYLSPDHTNQVYGDEYFFEGGAGYLDYTNESRLLIAHGKWYANLLNKHAQPGTLFDVGSAAGFILKGLTEGDWKGKGIEPNATMAAYARKTLQMDVTTGIFEQYKIKQVFDLVTMIQVIAHFYDVRMAFEVTRNMLSKNGLLLVETWDRESLPARILGSNWHHYCPPSVVNWFSVNGLSALAQQFGFKEIARGRPSKWINCSHAKSLLRYKLGSISGGNLLCRALNILPNNVKIPYPSLDLFWALFRKDN